MEDVVLKHPYLQLNRILMKEPQIHQKNKTNSPVSLSPQYIEETAICHLPASWWVKEIKPQDFTFYTNQKVIMVSFPACRIFKGILEEGVVHLVMQAIIIFLDYLPAS